MRIPVEQKPSAHRVWPSHTLQVSAQCALVERPLGCGRRTRCWCLRTGSGNRSRSRPSWSNTSRRPCNTCAAFSKRAGRQARAGRAASAAGAATARSAGAPKNTATPAQQLGTAELAGLSPHTLSQEIELGGLGESQRAVVWGGASWCGYPSVVELPRSDAGTAYRRITWQASVVRRASRTSCCTRRRPK